MGELAWIWGGFALVALVIGIAGAELSRAADIIADKTNLSGNWIGLILLGTVTSLPELVTGISSVTAANVPNIAIGNVFGACLINLLMLVAVDFLCRAEPIYRLANVGHVLSAGFTVVMIGFAGFSIQLAGRGDWYQIGHVGIYTPILIGTYLLAIRAVFVYERGHRESYVAGAAERYPAITLNSAVVRFAVTAATVVALGIALPFLGERLAEAMGWHTAFVGSLFVAAATTLPEAVVTIAALRIGAVNMALANLLGSNLFNMLILAVDDIFYREGPILAHVSQSHAFTAASAVVMTGLVIVSLLYRPQHRLLRLVGWTSIGLFAVYVFNTYIIYLDSK